VDFMHRRDFFSTCILCSRYLDSCMFRVAAGLSPVRSPTTPAPLLPRLSVCTTVRECTSERDRERVCILGICVHACTSWLCLACRDCHVWDSSHRASSCLRPAGFLGTKDACRIRIRGPKGTLRGCHREGRSVMEKRKEGGGRQA
jgi:hypothetical protein